MYILNYKFFNNNILRGILLKKYNITNSLVIPKIKRVIITLELKDKEDASSLENFLALNILTYLTKVKSCLVSHNIRYKFGPKHTLIFQAILRNKILKKKQIDLILFYNRLHSNILLSTKDLSFFSQLPAEFFKWDSGIKIEITMERTKNINISLDDLLCVFKGVASNQIITNTLKKDTFYNEIFNYKR
jgi:hypothetical protein